MSKPVCRIEFPDLEPPIYTADNAPNSINIKGHVNEGTVTAWLWTLIAYPSTATPSIENPTSQNTKLLGVTAQGNYLLMLTCTLQDGTTSETNLYLVPDTALRSVQVKTANAGLTIPARGERNWDSFLQEAIKYLDSHEIVNHADTTATGQQLNELTGGGYTELHKHETESELLLTVPGPLTADSDNLHYFFPLGDVANIKEIDITGVLGVTGDAETAIVFYCLPYTILPEGPAITAIETGGGEAIAPNFTFASSTTGKSSLTRIESDPPVSLTGPIYMGVGITAAPTGTHSENLTLHFNIRRGAQS